MVEADHVDLFLSNADIMEDEPSLSLKPRSRASGSGKKRRK